MGTFLVLVALAVAACTGDSDVAPPTKKSAATVATAGEVSDFPPVGPGNIRIGDSVFVAELTSCENERQPVGSHPGGGPAFDLLLKLTATVQGGPGGVDTFLEFHRATGGESTLDSFYLYQGERTRPTLSWEIGGGIGPLAPQPGNPLPVLTQRGMLVDSVDGKTTGTFTAKVINDYEPTGESVSISLDLACGAPR